MEKRMVAWKSFLAFSTAFCLQGLAGCHSNPYPDQGQLLQQKPDKPVAVFSIDTADEVDFEEGKQGTFFVRGHVPSGIPQISFQGLPAGAQFDAVNNQVVWTPDYAAATDKNDPTVKYRIYTVVVTLKDPNDITGLEVAQKTVTLIVHYSPRSFTVTGFPNNATLTEGTAYAADFQVQDDDFPLGPFTVRGESLPKGATVTQDKTVPTLFHLQFTPDYGFVTVNDSGYKTVNWTLKVSDPRQNYSNTSVQWTVNGNRQNPTVYAPQSINQGPPSVTFMMQAVDLNGEISPKITFDPPPAGQIALEDVASSTGAPGTKPFHVVNVKWTQIPATQAGQNVSLTLHSCVNDSSGSLEQCTTTTVAVTLKGGN